MAGVRICPAGHDVPEGSWRDCDFPCDLTGRKCLEDREHEDLEGVPAWIGVFCDYLIEVMDEPGFPVV